MPRFLLSCGVTVSATTIVKAETLDEAIKAAEDRQVVIGGSGTGADEEAEWIVEEADGAPEGIHGEEEPT